MAHHDVRAATKAARVVVRGELDLARAADLLDCILGQLSKGNRTVVVDLHGVAFIDAAGLNALVLAANRAREGACRVIVVNPSRIVQRTMDLAGVASLDIALDDPDLPAPPTTTPAPVLIVQ